MLVAHKWPLCLAVRGPCPRTRHLHAPTPERHLTTFMAMSDRGPVRVPLALRADQLIDLLLQQFPEHTQPDLDRQREQSLSRCPDQLPQRLLDTVREHSLITGRLSDRYVALHGGSSFHLG